jgi:hypothetical protein
VAVLLTVYAQCIDGQEEAAKRRVLSALNAASGSATEAGGAA